METSAESPRTRLLKGTVYSFAATVLAKLAFVINSIVVARLLGATQMGVLAILGGVVSLMSLTATFGIGGAEVKYIAEYDISDRSRLRPLISTAMTLTSLTAAVSALALIVLASPIATVIYGEPEIIAMLMVASIPLFVNAFTGSVTGVLQGFQRIKELSVRNVLSTFITVPAALALVFVWGLWGAVIAMATSAFIGLGVNVRFVGRLLKLKNLKLRMGIDRPEAKKLFRYATPVFFTGVAVTPVSWLVLTMLQQTSGFEAVGLYSVASGLAASLLLIPTAISTPMIPLISELDVVDKERMQSVSTKVLHMTFVFFLPVTMALALFSRLALTILYGEAYSAAWQVLFLLSAGTFLIATDNVIVCVLFGTGRIWVSFGLNVMWMVALIPTAVLLIPPLGALGLGIAYLISYVVYTAGVLAYSHFKFGIVLHDMEVILPIAAFAFVLSVIPSLIAEGLSYYLISFAALAVITAAVVVMLREYEWSFIRSILGRVSR